MCARYRDSVQRGEFDRFLDEVSRFEERVRAQRRVTAEHYDDDYFQADWRDGDNRYDLATRRRIEGRNPELIKTVFDPAAVLDVGCGPGFLMLFLQELGVDVRGVDFSPSSRDLAPPEVRDRITLGDISSLSAPDASYDLVVCREVMEHLTVRQVRQAVGEICRVSSRYIYLTTRFHPDPADLLDVTTQFDVDPTHITLLSKDFMRVLFILEGFRRRADLERQIDWAGKNRALVYERASV